MRTSYFSLDKISDRSDCEKLLKEYKIQNKLGQGAYGKVYSACKNENCNFVLKTMEFCKRKYDEIGASKLSYEYRFNQWKKEIKNHLQIIECQNNYKFRFVPVVFDAWFCNEVNGYAVFYIIMERFDGDLKDFIKNFSKYDNSVKILLKSFIKVKLNELQESLEFINNKCQICIDNIKIENILYKKLENETFELVFADFGTSIMNENFSQECIQRDLMRFKNSVNEFLEHFTI
jgi:serine/threonine protein kinase